MFIVLLIIYKILPITLRRLIDLSLPVKMVNETFGLLNVRMFPMVHSDVFMYPIVLHKRKIINLTSCKSH